MSKKKLILKAQNGTAAPHPQGEIREWNPSKWELFWDKFKDKHREGVALTKGLAKTVGTSAAVAYLGPKVLLAMNRVYTPSSWTNIYGLKILGNTAGKVADAAVQAGFTTEGIKGLYDQKQEGTLTADNPETYMNSLMLLPLAGKVAESAVYGINKGIQKASELEKKAGNAIDRAIANRKYNIEGTYENKDKFILKFRKAYPEQYFDLNTLSLLALNDHDLYLDFPFNVTETPEGKVIVEKLPLSSNFTELSRTDVENPVFISRNLFNSKLKSSYLNEINLLDDDNLLRLYLSSIGLPGNTPMNVSRYMRDLHLTDVTEAAAKELTKRLGFDFSNPINNYDKIALYIRFNPNSPYVKSGSQYELPGDVGHLYWIQGVDGTAEGALRGTKAAYRLSEQLPAGSAVTELNKSPESWMQLLVNTLRNYGTESGQNTLLFIKDSEGQYMINPRNVMQKTILDRSKLLNAFAEEGNDPKILDDYLSKFYRNPSALQGINRNPKLDSFIEKQINITDHVDLDRMNKYILMAREKTGLKDLPDATLGGHRLGRVNQFLFRLQYKPLIESFDFYSIRHKKGGKLISRQIK